MESLGESLKRNRSDSEDSAMDERPKTKTKKIKMFGGNRISTGQKWARARFETKAAGN